jgi:tetratricopeptide (TPR) repeat protein
LALVGITGAALLFVVIANLPQGPLARLRDRPYIGRIATMMDTGAGTNAVRVLIWEGVADMMLRPHAPITQPDGTTDTLNAIRPMIGYGPESMWVAFNRFYPPELAQYEARNASPDRSHNETFDSLARTGILGFAAQLYLFVSIFYYALRWLGLIGTTRRRNLFFALLAGGALLGVIIPRVVDGGFRLAGIGLPAGLITGLILYITLDVILSSRSAASVPDDAGATPSGGRRELWILTSLSAIVGFFVEIHFGIAIASTLALFWSLAAVLVVVGSGWLREEDLPELTTAPVIRAQTVADTRMNQRASTHTTVPSGKKGKRAQRAERASLAARQQQSHIEPLPAKSDSAFCAFLPFAAILSIVTLVLTWNYLVNQTGSQGAAAILWDSFTTRLDRTTFEILRSPFILLLMIITWLIGVTLALAESAQLAPAGGRRWALTTAVSLAATIGVFLAYGLIQATRMGAAGLEGLDVLRRVAAHIVFFDLVLFLLILVLAAALHLADPRPRPPNLTSQSPVIPLLGGALLLVAALLLIYRVNIRTIQADTYYKQGLAYEEAGSWEGAIVLYREAAALQPREDFYDLFLGRALLQLATLLPAGGDAVLPEQVAGLPVQGLLAVVDQGISSLTREDIYRATNAALTAARTSNPLNTDHSANLARLYRAWAFEGAIAPGQSTGNDALREIVRDRPDDLDLDKLAESQRYYEEAVGLSPQNAQLHNELAAVQYIRGDFTGALATLDRSVALDSTYAQSYLLRGDALSASGDTAGALDAYRQAAQNAPDDLNIQSAIGVLSAQLGRTDEAVDVFQRMIEADASSLAEAESELAGLDSQAGAAGGYDNLPMAARERRDVLKTQIAALRSQLHVTHRNIALVYRDAGQPEQALAAAREALRYANDAQLPAIESLIGELSGSGE